MRFSLFFGLMLTIGCSSSSTPEITVRGKVEYFGQPLSGGMIVFTPDADRGESGPLGFASIAGDGTYVLKSVEKGGVKAGWHRVTIAPPPDTGNRFPAKYRHPQSSGLLREVKKDGENVIDFRIE